MRRCPGVRQGSPEDFRPGVNPARLGFVVAAAATAAESNALTPTPWGLCHHRGPRGLRDPAPAASTAPSSGAPCTRRISAHGATVRRRRDGDPVGSGDTLVLGTPRSRAGRTYTASLTLARLLLVGNNAAAYVFLPVAARRPTGRCSRGPVETPPYQWRVVSLPLCSCSCFSRAKPSGSCTAPPTRRRPCLSRSPVLVRWSQRSSVRPQSGSLRRSSAGVQLELPRAE